MALRDTIKVVYMASVVLEIPIRPPKWQFIVHFVFCQCKWHRLNRFPVAQPQGAVQRLAKGIFPDVQHKGCKCCPRVFWLLLHDVTRQSHVHRYLDETSAEDDPTLAQSLRNPFMTLQLLIVGPISSPAN
eukprot:3918167-Amphidinium_carterae.1